jgi:hypothetical protein
MQHVREAFVVSDKQTDEEYNLMMKRHKEKKHV